jgi:Ca-activated chloride channel family protein
MSDGAQTTGRPWDDAARRARNAGVPVSTIAFGTAEGTVVLSGETIPVPPDPDSLRTIARLTEGRAFEAATADELTGVYRSIGRSVQTVEVHRPLMEWFLAASFILAMVAGGLSLLWFSRLP